VGAIQSRTRPRGGIRRRQRISRRRPGTACAATRCGRVGATPASSAAATAAARLDQRIDDVGALTVDVDCDAPERAAREAAAGDLGPGLTAIDGLVEPTPGTAAVHAAGGPLALVR